MKVFVVVEDDTDLQSLIRMVFSEDPRFTVGGAATSAEEGIEMARSAEAGVIVLDNGLIGKLTGIEAAPQFKEVAPLAKIILFTARAELQAQAEEEPAIDAFLLKTDIFELLSLAQQLTGLGPHAST
ncbi:MAG TPA: response regulator [Actinomycetota bacterium]|nr:response regulator [Actinomycetota bacterium]